MLEFNPPLLNSASPWATTREELQALYDCPYTGALTVRTSLLGGFDHDDAIHQHAFISSDHTTTSLPKSGQKVSSLNTYGYSPIGLPEYVRTMRAIYEADAKRLERDKSIIFSVTGGAQDIVECYRFIHHIMSGCYAKVLMEINLSCPNILGQPPPAYSKAALTEYLDAFTQDPDRTIYRNDHPKIGIKTPPYTHQDQFDNLISALSECVLMSGRPCPISFITATNTLGTCLILDPADDFTPVLNSANGTGIGGLAGAALHPLALGNVHTIRRMLDAHESLSHISIIGVGGVADAAGFRRMRSVGAEAVAVGTALGSEGIRVFGRIFGEVEEEGWEWEDEVSVSVGE